MVLAMVPSVTSLANAAHNHMHAQPLLLCAPSSFSLECVFQPQKSDHSKQVSHETVLILPPEGEPVSTSSGLLSVSLRLPSAPPARPALSPRLDSGQERHEEYWLDGQIRETPLK